MDVVRIKRGRDIPLEGAARRTVESWPLPETVAVVPDDFYGLRARVLVKAGDRVQCGTPILEDKADPRVRIVAPLGGQVQEIRRGEKRRLLAVVIQVGDKQDYVPCTKFSPVQIPELSRRQVVDHLLQSGCWPMLRRRPFDSIACPDETPKSIFIKAMDTAPMAPEYDVALAGQEEALETGLQVIEKLTDGTVYICCRAKQREVFRPKRWDRVTVVGFEGPHPAGNVGTHIHALDPVGPGEVVWHLDFQDVMAVGRSVLDGRFWPHKVIALTGTGFRDPCYARVVRGMSMASLIDRIFSGQEMRVISGNVLSGTDAGMNGFLGFYDTQISVIPKGGTRELLGWTMPGRTKFSFSRTFISKIFRATEFHLDSDLHGSPRAIVFNDVFDRYVALDVMTFFLIKAILAGEIDEMERLGLLECVPEDFSLAQFACPSKTDVCRIIRRGLDLIRETQE